MAADRTGDRMGNRGSGNGPLPGPATIRELNWAALNWAAHCSFLSGSSSPPCTPVFAPPESVRVSISHPKRGSSERPVCEDFEHPGVREIEHPGRNSSARLEFGRGEHLDSERLRTHYYILLRKEKTATTTINCAPRAKDATINASDRGLYHDHRFPIWSPVRSAAILRFRRENLRRA